MQAPSDGIGQCLLSDSTLGHSAHLAFVFERAPQALASLAAALCRSERASAPAHLLTWTVLMAASGAVVRYDRIPQALRWVCFVNPGFYLYVGLVRIEWSHAHVTCDGPLPHCPQVNDVAANSGTNANQETARVHNISDSCTSV